MTRKRRAWGFVALIAVLLVGCADKGAETPRWDISDSLPGAVRVDDDRLSIESDWGPRYCSVGYYFWNLSGNSDYNRATVPFEFGTHRLRGVEVRYFVVWMVTTSRPPNFNPASYAVERFAQCQAATPKPGEDDYRYHFNLTPIGTPESERFGWYETTVGPKRPPECDDKIHTTADGIGICPTPYQGTGMYTLVDGWILIGVDITTNNTSIDLKEVADADKLLNALAARVEADPLTRHDYDHRHDR